MEGNRKIKQSYVITLLLDKHNDDIRGYEFIQVKKC